MLSITLSPIVKVGGSLHFGFAKWDCDIFASIRLSRASATSINKFSTISRADMCDSEGLGGDMTRGGRTRGERFEVHYVGFFF